MLSTWPPEAIISLAVALLANLATGLTAFLQWRAAADSTTNDMHRLGWEQAEARDHVIESLRRMLHRGWTRESAAIMACELLNAEMPDDLSPRQERAIDRALELLEAAVLHRSSERSPL